MKPGSISGTSQLVTYAHSTSIGSAFSPARNPSSGPRPACSSRVTMTCDGSAGSCWLTAATATIGDTTSCRMRTTRCSMVSGPKGSSAFGVPMRVDLPPHRTMAPAVCILNFALLRKQSASAKTQTLRDDATGAHLDRAVLELRNLAERIEHRVGEHVRRRLVVAERHEHRPARHAVIRARVERDAAAPRGDGEDVARRHARVLQIEWMDRSDRLRLERIERRRATRHRAGVPVLELAPGDQHLR